MTWAPTNPRQTMTPSELDQYLKRVGYDGPRAPTLPVLNALTAAHAQAIPFENLDVLLGKSIELADDAVFDKLVTRRRGGYCFEQNGLFLRVLTAIGFEVTPLSARVRLDRPRDFTPPRTHLFIEVTLDGASLLTDVGVGGASLTSALRFETNTEQHTPHEPRRILREGGLYFHQVRHGDQWVDVCEFTGEAMPPIDREVANWFTSDHPQSHFKNRLMVARAERDGRRLVILNDEFKIRQRDGHATTTRIASASELLILLSEHFGLTFPANTHFDHPGALPQEF